MQMCTATAPTGIRHRDTATSYPHNFTSSAKVKRFSCLRRSGDHPGTSDPGAPLLPPGGVTPPGPAMYGMFTARCVNSAQKNTNWLGSQSKVTCASEAVNASPGEAVKYGVSDAAVAPLI